MFNRDSRRDGLVWWFTMACGLWIAGTACFESVLLQDATVPDGGQEECPHYFTWTVGTTRLDSIPSSGPITNIPEYHDCQRLIVAGPGDTLLYDRVYAIYASFALPRLDTVVDSLQALALPSDTPAVVAATIVSYGGTYDTLGVLPGFNCLYLSHPGGNWGAWLVPKGLEDASCPHQLAINTAQNVRRLVATAVTPTATLSADDVPAVARWDWDAGEREQYIGIRCGGAWCEVGDDASASPPPLLAVPTFSNVAGLVGNSEREIGRVTGIKGWQDAQMLAVRRVDGQIVPSGAWGVITPHPALHRHTLGIYDGNFVHVATASVTGPYNGKVLTLKPLTQNKFFLCMAPKGTTPTEECSIPDPGPTCGTVHANAVQPDTTWWAMITYWHGTDVQEYHCVTRRAPKGTSYPPIPGVARWRWLAADETTWTRCEHGCCENQ